MRTKQRQTKHPRDQTGTQPTGKPQAKPTRRALLRALGLWPVAGVAGWPNRSQAREKSDAVSQPSRLVIESADVAEYYRLKHLDLNEPEVVAKRQLMPTGKIGSLTVGRLISGSNLISLNMHARDLGYVRSLATRYNTEGRVFATLKRCEELGVNTIVLKNHNFRQFRLSRYWKEWGGRMQWIADVITTDLAKYEQLLSEHLDLGASAAYLWGGASDTWYYQKKPGNIVKAFEIMKRYGIPAGIAAHRLEPIAFCVKEGLAPDFYMLTLHHDRYWSAHPKPNRRFMEMYEKDSDDHAQYHDNMFCHDHEKTAAFMQEVKVPWIAFKVLAAGAIAPEDGFHLAFESGADFICVGMFDFQAEEDVRIARKAVAEAKGRKRPWA